MYTICKVLYVTSLIRFPRGTSLLQKPESTIRSIFTNCFIDAKPQQLTQNCARAQGSVPKCLRAGSGPCKISCMQGFNPATAIAQGDCCDRGIAGLGPKIIKHIKIFVLSTTEAQFLKANPTKNFCICEIKINSLDSKQDQYSSDQAPWDL